jgi:hypothetical protein
MAVPIDEYLEYYGITDPGDLVKAELDLAYAWDLIRDHTGQTIDLVSADVVTVFGTDTGALLLPQVPVVSVASVLEDGTALTPVTDYTVDPAAGILYRQRGAGALYGPTLAWDRWRSYTVTYTHGYAVDAIPAILKTVAFQIARSRSTGAGAGVTQESVAGYSVTYANDQERALLRILDRRVVRAVPVP